MSRLYDDNGIDLGEHAATAVPRAPGPWDHNSTIEQAQRDADAPVLALVAKYPERLAFIAGKLAVLKVKA